MAQSFWHPSLSAAQICQDRPCPSDAKRQDGESVLVFQPQVPKNRKIVASIVSGYYRTFIDEILESTPLEGTIGRARSLPATVRSRDEQLEEDEEVEMQNIVVTLEERAKNLQLGDAVVVVDRSVSRSVAES